MRDDYTVTEFDRLSPREREAKQDEIAKRYLDTRDKADRLARYTKAQAVEEQDRLSLEFLEAAHRRDALALAEREARRSGIPTWVQKRHLAHTTDSTAAFSEEGFGVCPHVDCASFRQTG